MFRLFDVWVSGLKVFEIIRAIEFGPGLISKAVKTYFDRKAVKTRLKPVKTGLNRSKHGQNLNSGACAKGCERTLLGGCMFTPLCMACVFGMLKTEFNTVK